MTFCKDQKNPQKNTKKLKSSAHIEMQCDQRDTKETPCVAATRGPPTFSLNCVSSVKILYASAERQTIGQLFLPKASQSALYDQKG